MNQSDTKKTAVCYVVGSCQELPKRFPFDKKDGDLVIGVDGGYAFLRSASLATDVLIGDFDSLDAGSVGEFQNELICLPKEKDATDMLAALRYGLQKGYTEFHIYGGAGGSMRHTYANIQLLHMLANSGARGYLYGATETLTVIRNTSVEFPCTQKGFLSVFSLTEQSIGIDLKNLKYPLKNHTMSDTFPLGVSNEFINLPASVSVKEGTLLLIYDAVTSS